MAHGEGREAAVSGGKDPEDQGDERVEGHGAREEGLELVVQALPLRGREAGSGDGEAKPRGNGSRFYFNFTGEREGEEGGYSIGLA